MNSENKFEKLEFSLIFQKKSAFKAKFFLENFNENFIKRNIRWKLQQSWNVFKWYFSMLSENPVRSKASH